MKIILKGVTRIVVLIGGYAIKIPNFLVQHDHFLIGCHANWSEYKYCKTFKHLSELYSKVAPTIFCTWFGLISLQKRVIELERNLTDYEIEYFKNQSQDIRKENFGWLNNRLVCIDYASRPM